jgi:hypothetical protein
MTRDTSLALALAAALAACAWQNTPLAGYPGLQQQIISYYSGRAMEAHALCPNPEITTITSAKVIEDTPKQVVMNIRYYWVDDGQTVDSGGQGSKIICQDFGRRTFTFARNAAGGLQVTGMTGSRS